jgi:hypothetical protein
VVKVSNWMTQKKLVNCRNDEFENALIKAQEFNE